MKKSIQSHSRLSFVSRRLHRCVVASLLLLPCAAQADELSGDLAVFHAGSLAVPLAEAAKQFQEAHPKVHVLREAAGSRECARKISDLHRPCDVMISADYRVIETLLMPKHADWCLKFAANEMVLAHTAASEAQDEITPENWPEILLRDDVRFGRSEPNSDPCGYRSVLTMRLAEEFYAQPGLADRLLEKNRRFIRPKETDLLALLETETIDYIFIYRSVAFQHHLEWLLLPDAINLKRPDLAEQYRKASVELSGDAPGKTMVRHGEPIVYGLTIPNSARNPQAARAFVSFLLEKDKGLAIIERCGQQAIIPAPTDSYAHIPEALKRFAKKP